MCRIDFLRVASTLFLLALAAPAIWAGEVHVVDGGGAGYVTIQAAVDIASDGDIVLVKPGDYDGFVVEHKALAIVADGAPVNVRGGSLVRNTLEQHTVVLSGLALHGAQALPDLKLPALELRTTRGAVRIQECTLTGADGVNCGHGCADLTMRAGGEALLATAALDVALTRCTLIGGRGHVYFSNSGRGGHGVWAIGSQIALHHSQAFGGHGAEDPGWSLAQGGDGGQGIFVSDTPNLAAVVFLAGTTARGGDGGDGDFCIDYGGYGGDGLRISGPTAHAWILDSSLQGGLPGCGTNYPLPGVGLRMWNQATATNWEGKARQLRVKGLVRELEVSEHRFEGLFGDLVLAWEAAGPEFLILPGLRSALYLAESSLQRSIVGSLPFSGIRSLPIAAPLLPPSTQGELRFLQASMQQSSSGFPPPVKLWLTNPAMQVVIDSSF